MTQLRARRRTESSISDQCTKRSRRVAETPEHPLSPYELDADTGWLVLRDAYGRFHHDVLPAVRCEDHTLIWYLHGLRHRGGSLPAYVEERAGIRRVVHYFAGQKHRDGDFAEVVYDVSGALVNRDNQVEKKMWVLDQLHCDSGPAEVYLRGHVRRVYRRRGQIHRDSAEGPAIVYEKSCRATVEYHELGLLLYAQDRAANKYYYRRRSGIRRVDQKDQLHRENDHPAVENVDGRREHWVRGKRHRDPLLGPAVYRERSFEEYWVNGKRHRGDDLPAVTTWHFDQLTGQLETEEQSWYIDDQLHRTSGPAEVRQGVRMWYVRGFRHSWSGPAISVSAGAHYTYYCAFTRVHVTLSGDSYWLNGVMVSLGAWNRVREFLRRAQSQLARKALRDCSLLLPVSVLHPCLLGTLPRPQLEERQSPGLSVSEEESEVGHCGHEFGLGAEPL